VEEKKYKIIITPFAEDSMREIAQYITYDLLAPTSAVRLLRKFQEEIGKLDFMPERVHLTPEEPWRSYGVRRLLVKNFYIYFWIDENKSTVRITDVSYVRRDQELVLEAMPLN